MSRDLSILIPSRNEQFLKNTVEDILKNKRGNTEIIVSCDGAWPDPPIDDHPDVTLLYSPESIGQRAGQNKCAKMSKAKWVMKCDSHCAFDEGFDIKMMEAMTGHDDWTMVPNMKNLHVFDWKCMKCGKRWYMGPVPTKCENPDCDSKDFIHRMVWKPRRGTNSTSYRFDTNLQFGYFNEYKAKQIGDIVETMSLQGSCFMCTRENYWQKELCDESWGSWGQQGTEVSAKTHTSGGRVIVNKRTWYAHMFRTRPGFSFPYPQSGKGQMNARKISQDIFLNNAWPKQIYPLSWLIEKFSPVPSWDEEALREQKEREMKSDRSGVYRIKCKGNNKVYIGSAKNFSQRFGEHLRRFRRGDHKNNHLQGSWDKYGESSFEFAILRFCPESELLLHEQKYIDEYKNKIGWREMFNMNPLASSGLGRPHSDESKEKMSVKQSGKNNGFYGKKHTEESIKKMKESHKGQTPWNKGIPRSEGTKKKISIANTGKEGWNKGLTKETDKRVEQYANNLAGKHIWSEREHPKGMLGKKHTEETKARIKIISQDISKTRERKENGQFE